MHVPQLHSLMLKAVVTQGELANTNCCPLVLRPIYAGNALETVQYSADMLQMFTVRPTAFEKASVGSASAAVEPVHREDLTASQVGTFTLAWGNLPCWTLTFFGCNIATFHKIKV